MSEPKLTWHHPLCEGECFACLIERTVKKEYGEVGLRYLLKHINAAASLQAKIDSLMLEYCPDEMTDEQLAEWGRHQVAVEGKEPWEVWQETSRTVYVSEDDAWSRRVIVQIGQSKCDICKEQTEVMNIDTSDGEYLSLDCCKKCLNKLWEKSSESK